MEQESTISEAIPLATTTTTMRTVYTFPFCLLISRYSATTAFRVFTLPPLVTRQVSSSSPTKLYDIHGWRDAGEQEVCILPFSLDEALLQGETKQLRLYEKRFIKLFDECMKDNGANGGVVAMGLIASKQNGILMHPPLCQVEAYNRSMEGSGLGIFVTIRAVGRVELKDLTQESPYIKATCVEIFDDHQEAATNLGRANLLASDIEHAMIQLSSLDNQLQAYEKHKKSILTAEYEDRSFEVTTLANDDSDDDDDDADDEDDGSIMEDRRSRFRQAYENALNADTQGYTTQSKLDEDMRSLRELTAVSWAAAVCANPSFNPILRLQALESRNVEERLGLALRVLKIERHALRKRLQDAKQAVIDDVEDEGEFL